ncbi:MAG: metalloregulator ArsR/SmtB family transcription factor [Verrucomicrobiota bacterium]
MDENSLSLSLKALADPVRLRILALLPDEANCEHGNNVSQLAMKLDMPQPSISHHLKILRSAEFVDYQKMCRDVFYWRNAQKLSEVCLTLGESLNFDLRESGKPIAKPDARIEEQHPSI